MSSTTMGSIELKSYDVLIIGAGLSGLCALHHIRERFPTWKVKVLEAASGPGGTWFWNRYPGARFDSESISYGYSWDKELLKEWHWKEAFSPQPETLKYIERVCEKHDLCKDIQFNTRIKSAQWQGENWIFVDENGDEYETRFFVSCLGFLSSPTLPNIPGVEKFEKSFHTSRWPDVDLEGKRVGVIGTGATGIQTITAIAGKVKSLTVFQRTANWSAPLRNTEAPWVDCEDAFKKCAQTPMGFLHQADPRKSCDVTDEERYALWEKLYSEPGFGKWLGTFSDTYTDRTANKLYSDYMASKIRERVHDPVTAEKLIPKNHGFGTRRVPLESGYFETFNKSNVYLDVEPISEITEKGVVTDREHELDVLIYATGFDAITGAFSAIDWQAKDGRPLMGSDKAVWVDFNPRTYLGITVPSMPNMFMVLGPHQPFGNATRSIEHAVDLVVDLLEYCKDGGYKVVEPTEEAVEKWTEHVVECSKGSLANEIDSWMTGVNKNVKGKTVRNVARYAGNAVNYRKICEDCKNSGWDGLVFQ